MATGTSFIIRDFEESIPLAGSPISDSRISGSRTSRGFRKESHLKVAFFVAWPIIAYMFMAIATAGVLFSAINEHHFRFSSTDALFAEREDGKLDFLPVSGLRQTDISTLISLASSLTRFLGSVCSGIACWRAAYLLLEREGLTLSDIDELVSYPFLRPWPWRGQRAVISLVVFFFLSSELYSPILNGSVAWKGAMSPISKNQTLTISTPAIAWRLPDTAKDRQLLVYQAVTYIATALGSRPEVNTGYSANLWRTERATNELPINSTLANITIPFFAVDSLEWINDPESTMNSTLLDIITRQDSGFLNYTSPDNPLSSSAGGYVALLPSIQNNNNSWDDVISDSAVVQRTTWEGARYVAITLGSVKRGGSCEGQTGQFFDHAPAEVKLYKPSTPSSTENIPCIAFARVDIRAGAGDCTDCRIASPLVLRNQSQISLQPDYLTEPTLRVMQEVSSALKSMNMTPASPHQQEEQRRMAKFINDTLTQAYCGTWSALAAYDRGGGGGAAVTLATNATTFAPDSQAVVDLGRVALWLMLNLFIAICCGIIALLQAMAGDRRVLVDATLAALLMDTTAVVDSLRKIDLQPNEDEEDGETTRIRRRDVSNMSLLFADERSTRVRLRAGEEKERTHIHFKLVPVSKRARRRERFTHIYE